MDAATKSLLIKIAALGAGAYLVYQYILKPVGSAASNAAHAVTDPIAGGIARAIIWWAKKPPIGVTGVYVLQPSGKTLNPLSYPVTWTKSDDATTDYKGELATIVYQGQRYVLGPHDEQGNWPALPASNFMF